MTEDEMVSVEQLVRAYTDAHQSRIAQPADGARRMLWASKPVRVEYRAVLEAVRAVAPQPRHSDAFVEGYVDDLLQGALDDPTGIADLMRSLHQLLEHAVATRLYVPLDGVEVEDAELRLAWISMAEG